MLLAIQEFIQGISQYQFLKIALITSVLIGSIAGVIGPFIILRGISLLGDAISHAVLPGVVISYLLGINYVIGATLFGLLAAFSIGFIQDHSRLKHDSTIGIVFSGFFALGVILIAFAKSSTDLNHILFGNLLAVRNSDTLLTAIIGGAVILFIVLFFKELTLSLFDPTMARAAGLNVRFFDYALIVMLTLVSVVSLTTVGTVLVIAMLITPAATAFLWTNRLVNMIGLAILIGVVASIIGIFFSYTYNLASGAAIVLTLGAIFFLSFVFSPKKGLLFYNRQHS
ncbi:MAG: metal ABC transporter permease [Aerococcus sp.]|nr:metal ABC transporter permease [Aerococcus sp.]